MMLFSVSVASPVLAGFHLAGCFGVSSIYNLANLEAVIFARLSQFILRVSSQAEKNTREAKLAPALNFIRPAVKT